MTFGTAITTCLRKYVTLSGRASRAEYWWFFLFTTLIFIFGEVTSPTLGLAADVVFLLPSLAVGWRRMHDIGKSGVWHLVLFLLGSPLFLDDLTGGRIFQDVESEFGVGTGKEYLFYAFGAVYFLYFLFIFVLTIKRGDVGTNEYGDDPYGTRSDVSVFD